MSEDWLILAGPTRTGTTSLFRYLARAPVLRAAFRKETDYFLDCLRASREPVLTEYRRLFVEGEGRCLEASPLYFAIGAPLARAIAMLPGDVKVLFTLREPVERFRSLLTHVQTKRNLAAPPDAAAFIETALASVDAPVDPRDVNRLAFREGCYREVLAEWIDVLGAARVRVVFTDSLERDPAAVLTAIADWLDLPRESLDAGDVSRENAGQSVRLRALHGFALWLNDRLEPVLNRLGFLRALLRHVYYALNGRRTRDPLTVAQARRLADAYAARNAGLRARVAPLVLGPIPDWVR